MSEFPKPRKIYSNASPCTTLPSCVLYIQRKREAAFALSLVSFVTQKCFDVTRKSGRKIIKFILHYLVCSCQVLVLSASRQQRAVFQKFLYLSNANTVRSDKLQIGLN